MSWKNYGEQKDDSHTKKTSSKKVSRRYEDRSTCSSQEEVSEKRQRKPNKNYFRTRKGEYSSDDSDTRSTSSSYSSGTSSEYNREPLKNRNSRHRSLHRTNKSRRRRVERYSSDSSQSTSIRRGLDYRQAPKMEKFKEESSGNIKSFFKKFEEYCRKNIREGRRFWINALEEHLEGKVADTFAQLRDEEDEYEEAKEKLIRWYKDSAESRRRSHNKKFRNAQPHEDESLYLFSIRLACMYKRAYPRHDVNKSKKLVK